MFCFNVNIFKPTLTLSVCFYIELLVCDHFGDGFVCEEWPHTVDRNRTDEITIS